MQGFAAGDADFARRPRRSDASGLAVSGLAIAAMRATGTPSTPGGEWIDEQRATALSPCVSSMWAAVTPKPASTRPLRPARHPLPPNRQHDDGEEPASQQREGHQHPAQRIDHQPRASHAPRSRRRSSLARHRHALGAVDGRRSHGWNRSLLRILPIAVDLRRAPCQHCRQQGRRGHPGKHLRQARRDRQNSACSGRD